MYQETFFETAQKLEVSKSIRQGKLKCRIKVDSTNSWQIQASPVTAAVFTDTEICRNVLQTDSASL
jgi:hypothetical protein